MSILASRDAAPRRVLVVDDDPDVRDSLLTLLATLGYEPHPAGDGEQALAALALVAPDVVLMDLNMPVMDGFEAARRVRTLPAMRGLPLVAYSAQSGERIEERVREAGFDRRLTKPAQVDQLLDVLASLGFPPPRQEPGR
jgi:two-component system CheB/CheR fusion protein